MTDEKMSVKFEGLELNKVLIAVFVIIVTFVVFLLYRRRRGARNGILLTGLCDSGKTLIYSQLIHDKFVPTHTSIQENLGNYVVNNRSLKVIDIPGHERLRDKFLEQYKGLARGIVFVIDSITIQQDVRDVAEFLYNLLADPVIINNGPNLLILCNKQDLTLSKGSTAIRSMLEKELNTLRITKSKQLESVDPKVKKIANLRGGDGDFSFSSVNLKVDFAESFAYNKNGSVNIEEFTKWLVKLA